MIHVCPLALLHRTVETVGARHVVTLMRKTDIIVRPEAIAETNHLVLSMDDISEPIDGYVLPGEEHVARLVDFVGSWDQKTPLVVHCYAGISRSTAAAFVSACALGPQRDEAAIAAAIRQASPTASPNRRIVSLADRLLGRKGRMIDAIEAIGPAQTAYEGVPFRLDLG
jgi:predicted protein tyrosine phosphatase